MGELHHLNAIPEDVPGTQSAPQPAQTAPSGPPVSAVDDVHLLDYVKVLYKRRWTAGTALAVVLLGTVVYTFTTTPIYEARVRLLIETDDPNVVTFKTVIEEGDPKADYYQTQYTILQSRALARKTIDTLALGESPVPGGGQQGTLERIAGFVPSLAGLFGSPDSRRVAGADDALARSRATDDFLEHLTVAPIRNSRLVDLKFRSADPAVAMKVVNALAANYIDQNQEYKFSASKEATGWLQERLAEQRMQVEAAEAALQQYREQNDAISLEDRQNIVVQKLGDLNAAVTRAKMERLQKEAMYQQLIAVENDPASLDTFPAILSNQFIQNQKGELANLQRQRAELADKLGDRHPHMIKIQSAIHASQLKLQGEIAKVVQAMRAEFQAALAQEQSVAAALDQQKSEAQSMNRKAIDYSVLERNVTSSRQIYDSLLQRARETGIAGELKASNIRIVDGAELPRKPVSPRPVLNLVLAVLVGGVLALVLVFFFEYIDGRIKSPDEIRARLGLSPIGLIPALRKNWHGSDPLINNGVPQNFAEAFRAVRTNVLFSSAEEGSRTLVVTSAGRGEGKTMVASNLAIGLAMAGERTLLIDGDMRCPRVHAVFGRSQEPGLSNVLVGNAKPSESVMKTDVPGLWVMAAGHIPPNPAELLASQRFKHLLRSVGEHFDCVVVDTPPVLAVTDATVAAHAVSGVVFVVGAEMTDRRAAKTAVDQLSNGHARFVGAVLNRVQLERHSYYYSRYYRREYAAYYQVASNG